MTDDDDDAVPSFIHSFDGASRRMPWRGRARDVAVPRAFDGRCVRATRGGDDDDGATRREASVRREGRDRVRDATRTRGGALVDVTFYLDGAFAEGARASRDGGIGRWDVRVDVRAGRGDHVRRG